MDPNVPGSKPALFLVPTAAAVAIALTLLRLHFEPPTVPRYRLSVPPEQRPLRAGERFEVVAQPAAPVTGAVTARAFLLRGDEVRAWDLPFEVARDGSVHIGGAVDALFAGVPAGPWEVALAVGRPETLPTLPKELLHARDGGGDSRAAAAWRFVRAGRVELGCPGP